MTGVNVVRRGVQSFQNRFPRTYLAIGALAFASFTFWDVMRVWESPIRGTSAFDAGTLVGVGFGLIVATGWIVAVYLNRASSPWKWWQWTTAMLWTIAVVTTHGKGGPQPAVTNLYTVGALWYEILAFVGAAATLATILFRQRRGGELRRGQ